MTTGTAGRSRAAALLLAALAAAAPAGCSAPLARASLRGSLERVRAARSRPAPSPFGEDAPGILHCHTRLSHDSPGPLEEVVAAARACGVRWVCLTDHSKPATASWLPRGEVGGVLLVPGEEITRDGGSVLAMDSPAHVLREGRTKMEVADEVRAGGGAAFWGHATHFHRPPSAAPDGLAVYDLSDDFRATAVLRMPAVLWNLASGDPERSAEAYLLFVQSPQEERRRMWDAFRERGPCAGLAETNAHAKFRYLGRTIDPYASLFPLVRNHALLDAPGVAGVMDAVRTGRAHVGFDAAADTTGARFELWRGETPAAAMGGGAAFDPALSLAVHLPLPAAVRVLRGGRPWREGRGRVLFFPVDGPGVYRAEVDLEAGGEERPWILFNPIEVLPAPGNSP